MPVKYINVKVRISDEQKAKIRNALHSGLDCINIRLKAEDLTGEDLLALTQTQVNTLQKTLEQNKGATIRMSKTQIKQLENHRRIFTSVGWISRKSHTNSNGNCVARPRNGCCEWSSFHRNK